MIRRVNDSRGSAPVELALAVALLLVPVTLGVLSLAPWAERQMVARIAAREAARVAVLADSFEEGAGTARRIVDQVARNHGLDPSELSLELTGDFERGATITATVGVDVPILVVPGMGSVAGPALRWSTAHRELVDLYRSFP